MLRKKKLRKVH